MKPIANKYFGVGSVIIGIVARNIATNIIKTAIHVGTCKIEER